MRHPHTEAPVALTAGSQDRLASEPGALFVYGTLQFPTVLEALIGRIPSRRPTAAPGWRAAALERRVYPGLVAAPGSTATGFLIEDLTPTEWKILDDFEDDRYDLREITLSEGLTGWAYVWPDGEVLPYNWQADYFADRHLAAYTARFKARVAQRESPAC